MFGSFRVIYDNPQREKLSVLALSAPELIQTGTVEALEGGSLRFEMTLFYDQQVIKWAQDPTRRIESVWSFETPSSYSNSWVEDQGIPVDPGTTIIEAGLNGIIESVPAGDDERRGPGTTCDDNADCPNGACDGREVLKRFGSSTSGNRNRAFARNLHSSQLGAPLLETLLKDLRADAFGKRPIKTSRAK